MSGGLLVWLIFILLCFPGLLVGLILLIVGLRGKRLDRHPICRKCRYDLVGSPKSRGSCPECGAALTTRRARRIGNRKRRSVMAILGLVLTLLPVVLAVMAIGSANINEYKPLGLLRFEARQTALPISEPALDEISRRIYRGSLTNTDLADLLEDATAVCESSSFWKHQWESIVLNVISRKAATAQQEERFAKSYMDLAVIVRKQVRQGQPIPIMLYEYAPSLHYAGSSKWAIYGVHKATSISVGQSTQSYDRDATPGDDSLLQNYFWLSTDQPPFNNLPPGVHEVRAAGPLEMMYIDSGGRRSVATWPVEASATFELLPHDAPPTVRLIEDPVVSRFFTSTLKVGTLQVSGLGTGNRTITIDFDVPFGSGDTLKYKLGCEIYIDDGTGRWLIGFRTFPGPGWSTYEFLKTSSPLPDDFDAKRVDIILIPSIEAAERTVDITEILNHDEIVFEDVEVEWEP